jgi:AAA+ ATPase superfamily predicted ATPase
MNPFQLNGYHGSDTFCDREIESRKLYNAIDNERNVTLTSIRKMGKSGLIKHVLHQLRKNKKEYSVYYIDIYHTQNLADFIEVFGKELMDKQHSFPQKIKNLLKLFIQSLNPTITYDPLNGVQNISLSLNTALNKEQSIVGIFSILSQLAKTKKVVVDIDEFQQISNYTEKNVEPI